MNKAFRELMAVRNLPARQDVKIEGVDPVYATPFLVGEAGASALAAVGVAVSDIHEMKTGRRQSVSVDVRHAAAALHSFAHLQKREEGGNFRVMGNSPAAAAAYEVIQPYPTKDDRWFLPHFGLSHLKERVAGVLQCEVTPDAVAQAVCQWDAQALEDAIAEVGGCGGIVRTPAEWLAHPQGKALAARPVVEIEKIADSAPEPFPTQGRVLSGVRVLDLTRILAGPVAARTLAEHGADVLMVGARSVPQIKNFVIDLSHGKRSCNLDIKNLDEATRLKELVQQADVFSQGFRPGVLDAHGFGVDELAALRPGLIYTTINCYGQHGPSQDRAGWEQVAQAVTGICHDNGLAGNMKKPTLLPVNACDYITGYLGAYGTLLALARRAVEGGSYHVKVSLCQTAMLLERQGRVEVPDTDLDITAEEATALQMESQTSYGYLRHLAPVIRFSETTPHWSRPTPALGGDEAVWLE
jgi:crotonobetainyl-CoA:carnitine CoA-transferase CaiB-like acyl-CoA transferase